MSGDENSQKDMSAFVQGCDRLRERTKAAVLVIHHEGKDPGKGARGSNVLRGAWDTGIRVKNVAISGVGTGIALNPGSPSNLVEGCTVNVASFNGIRAGVVY